MAKKYYAVRRGRTTGIFTDWMSCKASIDGFQGARYKGFLSREEAEAWLLGDDPRDGRSARPMKSVRAGDIAETGTPGSLSDLFGKSAAAPAVPEGHLVYTDGSCLRNPAGPGGWAVCIVDESAANGFRTVSGGVPSTTNNRMEMTAVIEALRTVSPGDSLTVVTDSQYVKNGITKWIFSWKKRGWKKADGESVLNQDLWMEMDRLMATRRVDFQWVKGHAGSRYNEICDALAKKEASTYT
ncbi:hypothetical protein TAMA11512_00170 [Selenomonas sp. TAMA-11512]|uniref:ribonuclease HI n=1 Tax=Selenomonas sp. TAMA-11512 TaxID=3095337 RepID=UPI00308D832A|nr:hypothetical protein TAMA11512_00170 [Selenomonas sp. TAMA-11512]